ncbi:MAG: phospholipid/cholesterol/gamma-HCH transport system substrate-binding protein [Frankiales bacterium]|nr:phospholipid/cholesterol/gamma-HCH transport system substrate-binding protein [Frankiales bacterium]
MSSSRPIRTRLLALTAVLGLSSMAAGCGIFGGSNQKHFSAEFSRAIGVYKHSDVRVLGVRIGEVTKITPEGDRVKIDMSYDASYKIPAGAKAVILAPSIVSDRYVQLTPVYSSGPTLPDGAQLTLGSGRTAEPVELDEIYKNIDTLNQALGPHGANSKGALSDLLKVGANNLRGNGKALNSTVTGLSQAVKTLSDSRGDLFTTIANLQTFTTTIAQNDSIVAQFNQDLAAVAAQLNGERNDLATAIKTLASALGEVASFVKENSSNLTANISNLKTVTQVLVKEKAALREFLDTAPTALSNLQLAYNPSSGTLDTRDNSSSAGGPTGALCNLLAIAGQSAANCRNTLGLPPLPTAKSSAATSSPPRPSISNASTRDLTMAGILEAS